MRTLFCIFTALGFVFLAVVESSAHLRSDKTFVAVQVPIGRPGFSEFIPDGDTSEWANIDPSFWITHEDLIMIGEWSEAIDPSDLALRIIIGWSPVTNKIYWFEDRFDDVYVGWKMYYIEETVAFGVDADHSGGRFQNFGLDVDPDRHGSSHAQHWQYFVIGEDPVWLWGAATWVNVSPYSEFGWSFDGELGDSGNLIVEMAVTPFDDLNPEGIDQSVVHTLKEGEIIGIGFTVEDTDYLAGPDEEQIGIQQGNGGYYTVGGAHVFQNADTFNDFTLLPFDPEQWVTLDGSSVESDTWGRIKATFSN